MKYMKPIIVLLALIYSVSIYSQEKDSIIYIFPDKVEQKLYEQIKKVISLESFNFKFYLQTISKDEFRIAYSYEKEPSKNYWINNTNRFILIKNEKYPLILDYDSLFSTNNPKDIGEYGHREGYVLKSLFLFDGYNITFDKEGECLFEDWGIHEKRSD